MLARAVLSGCVVAACSFASVVPASSTLEPPAPRSSPTVLFSPEGNNLNAYEVDRPYIKQTVIAARSPRS